MGFIDRLLGRSGAPQPQTVVRPSVRAELVTMDLDSPVLREFMRNGGTFENTLIFGTLSIRERRALRNSTFFRAVHLISATIGMLPTFLMRRKPDGTIEKAKDHPLFKILHKRPNNYQTALEFKAHMQLLALLDGAAYALIIRGVGGKVRQIVPLKRRSVTPELTDTFDLRFKYDRPTGGTIYLPAADVFHFRHPMSLDGIHGLSLLDIAVNSVNIASQAERAASKMLSGGVMAGGSLETDKTLGEEAIKNLRESLHEDHSGVENAGDWLILEEGLKAKPFITNAKDAQYDELRKRQAEEVSRFTDVPRPLLMFDETSWGTGIEQLGLFFVQYCLMQWFVAWEQALERSCLTEAEQDADELYVKINEGALLRGSLKDQSDFFAKALGMGGGEPYRTVNEVRDAFDLSPVPGGEKLPPKTPAPAVPPKEPTNA
jgi:HK97 family phage portal protein